MRTYDAVVVVTGFDRTRGIDAPKTSPDVVVQRTGDGLGAGAFDVLADERTQPVHAARSDDPAVSLLA